MRKRIGTGILGVLLGLVAALALLWGGTPPATPEVSASGHEIQIEWYGWSHFRLTSVSGKTIVINPFIQGNPDSSVTLDDITQADLILAADGHGDEVGSTVDIAKKTGARVFVPFELGSWIIQQGVPAAQVIRSNPGGRLRLDGVTVRMVGSIHGSGLPRPTPENPYGGPAAGFFITFENGFTVYFAGSTAVTKDMELWRQMYWPDLAILPLNGDREPLEVAHMVRLLRTDNTNLRWVMPHHHRVQPQPGQTRLEEVMPLTQNMGLDVTYMYPERGRVMRFAK